MRSRGSEARKERERAAADASVDRDRRHRWQGRSGYLASSAEMLYVETPARGCHRGEKGHQEGEADGLQEALVAPADPEARRASRAAPASAPFQGLVSSSGLRASQPHRLEALKPSSLKPSPSHLNRYAETAT